jgi:hypothetical protein
MPLADSYFGFGVFEFVECKSNLKQPLAKSSIRGALLTFVQSIAKKSLR